MLNMAGNLNAYIKFRDCPYHHHPLPACSVITQQIPNLGTLEDFTSIQIDDTYNFETVHFITISYEEALVVSPDTSVKYHLSSFNIRDMAISFTGFKCGICIFFLA